MSSFSQRKGLKPIRSVMQIDSMDAELRNGLWNGLQIFFWDSAGNIYELASRPSLYVLVRLTWRDFFKKPVDDVPRLWLYVHRELKAWFFKVVWYQVYDFIEFVAENAGSEFDIDGFIQFCNAILEREMSAYRFVDGLIAQLTSEEEIAEIERAINAPTPLSPVAKHLRTALERLSDKTNPDYRNSIKESISAVESMCNLITGHKDTLGEALKKVEIKIAIHSALKKGFSNIYGYTSDASGIRHALLDEPNLDFEDAKYMLVSCSAFVNYLTAKANKAGLTL